MCWCKIGMYVYQVNLKQEEVHVVPYLHAYEYHVESIEGFTVCSIILNWFYLFKDFLFWSNILPNTSDLYGALSLSSLHIDRLIGQISWGLSVLFYFWSGIIFTVYVLGLLCLNSCTNKFAWSGHDHAQSEPVFCKEKYSLGYQSSTQN